MVEKKLEFLTKTGSNYLQKKEFSQDGKKVIAELWYRNKKPLRDGVYVSVDLKEIPRNKDEIMKHLKKQYVNYSGKTGKIVSITLDGKFQLSHEVTLQEKPYDKKPLEQKVSKPKSPQKPSGNIEEDILGVIAEGEEDDDEGPIPLVPDEKN